MKFKYILANILLVNALVCEKVTANIGSGGDKFYLYRCENSEVICYIRSGDSNSYFSCKFKE